MEKQIDRAMMQLMLLKSKNSEETLSKSIKRGSLLPQTFDKYVNKAKKLSIKPAANQVRRGGRVKKAVAKPFQQTNMQSHTSATVPRITKTTSTTEIST
jgi:hypothetical protein